MPGKSCRIFVVGSGGREHAIVWKLAENNNVDKIFVAPGNAGTESVEKAENVTDLDIADSSIVVNFCKSQSVSLVVVGPEDPLANGIADVLEQAGVACFGPLAAAARIEASKAYSKDFMKRHNIPTARFQVFTRADHAIHHIRTCTYKAWVVKASGLAAGKGVRVCKSSEEACCAAYEILEKNLFGSAGNEIVVEEFLEGPEVSAMCFTDGTTVEMMPVSQDHKRLTEGDKGPNTGGMGAYAPCPLVDQEMQLWIKEHILAKTINALKTDGISYCGVLYAGLMLTSDGPKVLEFNCRMGDPETQVLLPLLNSDLLEVMEQCTQKTLDTTSLSWKHNLSACGIVAVSHGYPGNYKKGCPINGLESVASQGQRLVFLAGAKSCGDILTCGGRVLSVVGLGPNLLDARNEALKGIGMIDFEGKFFRRDIAYQSLKGEVKMSYEQAGVNVSRGNELVERIKPFCKETTRKGCETIGGFGACVDLAVQGYKEPVLVLGTDGVGTKLLVAQECGKWDRIGQDLVAMCVNDVLCHGAEPVAFLDYYSTGQLDVDSAGEVIEGIAKGCKIAGCALLGGETSEMPGVYGNGEFDVAGFAVGVKEKCHPELPLKSEVRVGDTVLGLSSSGVHSNGLSLVRKIVSKSGLTWSHPAPWLSAETVSECQTLGDIVLTPTRIYVKELLDLLRSGMVKGVAHITGGGLLENIPRILPDSLGVELDESRWMMPEIFHWLMKTGPVDKTEMHRTFNCGLGMVLIVDRIFAEEICNNMSAFVVGEVIQRAKGAKAVRIIHSDNLIAYGKDSFKNGNSVSKNGHENLNGHSNKRKVRVGVLISGTGTNLESLIKRSKEGTSLYEIVLVISNVEGVGGLAIAARNGIKHKVINHKGFKTREEFEDEITTALITDSVQLICLAGFMRILHKKFVERWRGRLLNIHPSLLPSFRGANAHKMALQAGVKISGCTVHYAAEEVDAGAIISQAAVPVLDGDTEESLSKRVKLEEHRIFPQAVQIVAKKLLENE